MCSAEVLVSHYVSLGVSSPFSPSHRTVRASRFFFSPIVSMIAPAQRVCTDMLILLSLGFVRSSARVESRRFLSGWTDECRRYCQDWIDDPSLPPRTATLAPVADDFPLSDCVSWRASIVVQEVHVSSCMSRVLMQEEAVRPDLHTEPLPTCLLLRLGCPTYGHQFTSSVGTPPCASTSDRFGVSTGHGKRPSPRSSHYSAARACMP